ncbi:MAG: TRAP transporter substrate-binding protein [Pseudomonadota bacterium]
MKRRDFLKSAPAGAAIALATPHLAKAQSTALRLHQFLPPQALIPSQILVPWANDLAEATDGDLTVQHFDAMALGGAPPDLFDQSRDGIADVVMTLGGYTPGRFPRTEVFDLPFIMKDPIATARAYWEMMSTDFQDAEYADTQILTAWVHGPGVIHTSEPVERLEDMGGKTLRGPTRVITDLLAELGAEPVGMPVPAIPEALSRGVIDGTVIPWEVTASLRLSELLDYHTEITGDTALYTTSFVLSMNKASYEGLPDDLRTALDSVSGADRAMQAAGAMVAGDAPARQIAVDAGNTVIELDAAEVDRWRAAAAPVTARWVESMAERDIDGQALIDRASALIDQYTS